MSTENMTGIARGVTPLNTGKVLIGRDYIPRKPQYATEAELFWQGVLLRKKPRLTYTGNPTSVSLFSRRLVNLTRAIGAIFRRK